VVVHPDGTIFALQTGGEDGTGVSAQISVIGIDPISGTQKFNVPLGDRGEPSGIIVAGDGNAYISFGTREAADGNCSPGGSPGLMGLNLFRITSSGAYDQIHVYDWTSCFDEILDIAEVQMITNADVGVLMTWRAPMILNGSPYHMGLVRKIHG
jgi:hypothetical protein